MAEKKILLPGRVCEEEHCHNLASEVIYSRQYKELMACCEKCAERLIRQSGPEYIHHCPNCGCTSPVN